MTGAELLPRQFQDDANSPPIRTKFRLGYRESGPYRFGIMYRMLLQSLAPVSLEDLINKADAPLYDALMESVREDIRIVGKKVELLNLISGQAGEK